MKQSRLLMIFGIAGALAVSTAGVLHASDCPELFARIAGESTSWTETKLWQAARSAGRKLKILVGPSIPRAKPREADTWADSAQSLLQSYVVPVGKALVPFPLPRTLGRGETYSIFRKVWRNPEIALSEAEKILISARKMDGMLEDFRVLLRENPGSVKARKILEASATAAIGVGAAAGVIHFVNQAEQEVVSSDAFLNDPRYRIGNWQAQLINETIPFPHLAIRMGQRVYSYGETHMTVTSVVHYLEEQRFADLWKQQNPEAAQAAPTEPDGNSASRTLSAGMKRAADATGFSSLPRSVQITTLNLPPEDYRRLRSYLEDQTGKRYHNVTFVNDCASMIVRALERNTSLRFTQVLDASPSQVVMALSVMKAAGDDRVDSVRLVAVDRSSARWTHLFRNLYINTMESKVFVAGFLFNQGWRGWIDATMDESELQSHEDEVREVIEKKWREETEAFMKAHRKVQPVLDALAVFDAIPSGDPRKQEQARMVLELLDYTWEELETRESGRASSALESFQSKTLARYRLEWLQAARARIQQELGVSIRKPPATSPGS